MLSIQVKDMDFDFSKSMHDNSDAELIKILATEKTAYQEAAIIAAEKEVATRNLSVDVGEQLPIDCDKKLNTITNNN